MTEPTEANQSEPAEPAVPPGPPPTPPVRVLGAFALGFTILGWIAMPVAVVWLLLLKQWWALLAVVASFVAPLVISIVLVPGLGIAAAAAKAAPRSRFLGIAGGFLGLLYMAATITAWCMGVLTVLVGRATPSSWIPLVLLSYAVAVGPWKRLARKELREGRRGESVQTFFLQLGMFLVVLGYFARRPADLTYLWWLFGSVMWIEVLVYMWPVFSGERPPAPAVDAAGTERTE